MGEHVHRARPREAVAALHDQGRIPGQGGRVTGNEMCIRDRGKAVQGQQLLQGQQVRLAQAVDVAQDETAGAVSYTHLSLPPAAESSLPRPCAPAGIPGRCTRRAAAPWR